jgi:Flp pilus assembly protein TadB
MILFDFEIPEPIYKILPVVYVVGGAAMVWIGASPLYIFSGVILVVAGIVVWRARMVYKKNMSKKKAKLVKY